MATTTVYHPADTLVTSFVGTERHITTMTLADLQRIAKVLLRPTGRMVIEYPAYTVITWRPLTGIGISNEERAALGLA